MKTKLRSSKTLVSSDIVTKLLALKGSAADIVDKTNVLQLQGTNFWQLSEEITIPTTVDYSLKLNLLTTVSDFYILGSSTTDNNSRLVFADTGTSLFGLAFSNNKVPSSDFLEEKELFVERISGVTRLYVQGVEKTSASLLTSITLGKLGGPYAGTTSIPSLQGYMRNFELTVDGVEVLKLNLTNKDQGATQLPEVGTISATATDYSVSDWIAI